MEKLQTYFRTRAWLLGSAAVLGAWTASFAERAPSADAEGVERAVEKATGHEVSAFVWEPPRGPLLEFLWGRPLLFEGARITSSAEETPESRSLRDIYRAFVRLSPDGKVLDVHSAFNLTRTRSSDETGLSSTEEVAVFLAEMPNSPPSLSVLHFAGETSQKASNRNVFDALQLGLARFLETGSFQGLGRTDVLGSSKDDALRVTVAGDQVELLAQTDGTTRRLEFSAGDTDLPSDEHLFLIPRQREPIPWLHFLANSGRRLLGNDWVAWAEGRFFSLRDMVRRAEYSVRGPTPEPEAAPAVPPQRLDVDGISTTWPPEDLRGPQIREGDGKWIGVDNQLLPQEGAPLFYRTVLHPDPMRPYAELHLVAMDMRRLELNLGAGYEDPEPDSGPPGSGQIPNEKSVYSRVVATFNGAFKATHGRYGMKAEGRILVPPQQGAATVAIDHDARTGFGVWSEESSVRDFRALRQNLQPLIAEGELNPSGRTVWGDHLYGENVAVQRSALCLHESGQILYAWATEATGLSLAEGLSLSGCRFAIHLDMNPGHCSFSFNAIQSIQPLSARGELLDPRMKANANRFVRWSPKDFFYVSRRAGASSPRQEGAFSWQPSKGQTPPPRSVTAIFTGTQDLGGIELQVDKIDVSRFRWVVHPTIADGLRQPEERDLGLEEEDRSKVLLTYGLGHATLGNQTGLTFGRHVLRPLRRTFSSLVLVDDGSIELLAPSEPLAEKVGRVVVQLPTVARDGELLDSARELGGKRTRSALCFDSDHHMYIGRITHDTIAPLGVEMVELGCDLVVEMDRGSHSPLLVERAGTDSPPHVGHEQTVLYGLSKEMAPKTFTF